MKTLMFMICMLAMSYVTYCQDSRYPKKYYKEERAQRLKEIAEKKKTDAERNPKPAVSKDEENEMTHFNRWDYINRNRTMADGSMANWPLLNMNEDLKIREAEQNKNMNLSTNAGWQLCGPNLVNMVRTGWVGGIGRVNCMEWDAANNLYVGSPAGGLWKLTGSSWSCLTNSIPSLGVSGICIDPSNNDHIYILTGDGDGGHSPTIGVLKTTNGGISWQVTALAFTRDQVARGYKLIMHPANPAIQIAVGTFGIFKTTDSWNTATLVQDLQYPSEIYFDIEFKPATPATVYATSQFRVYKSTNTGSSWSRISHAQFSPSPDTINISRTAIEVSDAAANQVFVLHGGNGGYKGIYRSTTSGSTFFLRSSTPNILGRSTTGADLVSQASFDLAFEVDPGNSSIMFVGGIMVFRSTNAGSTWDCIGNWSPNNAAISNIHADQHELRLKSGLLYSANDGGIVSRDPYNWPQSPWNILYQGLNITQFYKLGMDPTGALNRSYMGAQDNGVMLYDGDDNFEIIRGGDGGDAIVDYTDHDKIFYIVNGRVYQENSEPFTGCSSQNGYPWGCVRAPSTGCGCPDDPWDANEIMGIGQRPLIYNPSNINNVYSGYSCIHESDDGGDNWHKVSCVDSSLRMVADFDFSTSHKWMVNSGFVFRETAPDVWSDASGNLPFLPDAPFTSLAKQTGSPLAWVACGGYNAAFKVLVTANNGISWTPFNDGLPNVPVNTLAFDEVNFNLYAGTDIGVFYRPLLGNSWLPYRNGMPSIWVTEIEISHVDNHLYAATFGRGLWKTPLVDACLAALNLSGSNVLPAFSQIESSGTITSDAVNNQGTGQHVNLIAGNSIVLLPGAESGNGTEFHGRIGNCNSPASSIPATASRSGYLEPSKEFIKYAESAPILMIDRMNIFPNPSNGIIHIEFTLPAQAATEITIMDAYGRTYSEYSLQQNASAGNNSVRLNISSLPPGIYFGMIRTKDNSQVRKFVLN